MSHSLVHHTRPHPHSVLAVGWTVHWTVLVTLAVILVAVLFLGVPVAQ
jgi:hypothetical protein